MDDHVSSPSEWLRWNDSDRFFLMLWHGVTCNHPHCRYFILPFRAEISNKPRPFRRSSSAFRYTRQDLEPYHTLTTTRSTPPWGKYIQIEGQLITGISIISYSTWNPLSIFLCFFNELDECDYCSNKLHKQWLCPNPNKRTGGKLRTCT